LIRQLWAFFCFWVPGMEGREAVELLYDIPPIVLREE
jgi:hypothetical protein